MPKFPAAPEEALAIIDFWFVETLPEKHYAMDRVFDLEIKGRFAELHGRAARGVLDHWQDTPNGALALVVLLDQFTRNLNRNKAAAFAQDAKAKTITETAIENGFDGEVNDKKRAFFYMPFMHSEDLADQEHSVTLFQTHLPDAMNIKFAEEHRDVIKRFGRFPHRNQILSRDTTAEEASWLADGGFNST